MEDIILKTIKKETRPQPKTALLTFSEYFILNEKLSNLKGYELSKDTERVFTMLPQLAKVNIKYDAKGKELSYENLCVMPISSELQETFPELMPVLVESYIPSTDQITEIETEAMTTSQVDWCLKHFAATKANPEYLILMEQPRSKESDEAVKQLIGIRFNHNNSKQ